MNLLRCLAKSPGKPKVRRDSRWSAARKDYLKHHPYCAACGTKKKREVHHVIPVHVDKGRELDPTNMITLCQDDHLVFGHFHDWQAWNPAVAVDTKKYLLLLTMRMRKP